MDFIVPVIILVLLFITCSICGYCCKRNKQGVVYGTAQPVTTTTTQTNYQATPYPVMETPMPQPTTVPPQAGFTAPYPLQTPYPPAGGAPYPPTGGAPYPPTGGAPYPPASSGYPTATPYPNMPMPGAYTAPVPAYPATSTNQLPPSYAEAVGNNRVNEGYVKQEPYNPHYN